MTPVAYDWNGSNLVNWWTLWLDSRIDLNYSFSPTGQLQCQIIDFAQGLKSSGSKVQHWLYDIIRNRQDRGDYIFFDSLLNISEFLKTYTGEDTAKKNRARLRLLCTNEKRHEDDC